jgi:hypothetical protein
LISVRICPEDNKDVESFFVDVAAVDETLESFDCGLDSEDGLIHLFDFGFGFDVFEIDANVDANGGDFTDFVTPDFDVFVKVRHDTGWNVVVEF